MRRMALFLVVALLGGAPAIEAARAEEDAPPPARTRWSGYLWRGDGERVELGWGVIAMGVMAQPAYVIDPALAANLGPLVSDAGSSYVFWNYSLERADPRDDPKLPRWLVELEGVERAERPTGSPGGWGPSSETRHLGDARLVAAEPVSDAWLRAWRPVFLAHGSPWRIRLDDPPFDPERQMRTLATTILEAVRAMRAVPAPGEEERVLLANIDPEAELVTRFREQKEHELVRWLRKVDAEHGLALAGLDDLGPVPPDARAIQRLFLAAETKKAFFEALARIWSGPQGALVLHHYDREEGRTWWTSSPLDEVEAWDEATYDRYRKITREMLGS